MRRQLTVLFADLVGSTELALRMDPEDLGDVLLRYEHVVRREVTRLEGTVVQVIGDGIVAGFGHPVANEDDAERAIRAGLSIIEAIDALPAQGGSRLRVRVAVATGSVLIGDPSGADPLGHDRVIGETPNLAARLQEVASPQGLVIDDLTRRLAGRQFAYRALGTQRLKGFEEPVSAFAVDGVQMVESRFAALRGTRLGPLIGRDGELARLKDMWSEAVVGSGRFVSIVGEPGIGKSRLVLELIRIAEAEGAQVLHYQCSAIHANSPFHPIFARLQYAAGIRPDDAPDVRLAKLRAELTTAGPRQQEAAELFAQILSQPTERVEIPTNQRKELVLDALMRRLHDLAERTPLMIVVEDTHWADPSTLAVINRAFDIVRALPVLVLVTARPEFQPTWPEPDAVVTLQGLHPEDCRHMVEAIAGRQEDRAVVDDIVATTGGNPLFVEEVATTLVGADADTGDASGSGRSTSLPRSLQGALNAHLDRLGEARRAAQFAAVMGRQFSFEMLHAVWPFEPEALETSLDVLQENDVIRPVVGRADEMAFKHALVQEAAYQSLIRPERRRLHGWIGERLEERFQEFCLQQPDLLAAHFEAAKRSERAVHYRRHAAELAINRSAYTEATNHLRRVEVLLDELPAGEERDRAELECRLRLGTVLTATRGYADAAVAAAFGRAASLVAGVGSPIEAYMANLGLWRHAITVANMDDAERFAGSMLRVATEVGRAELALTAQLAVGITTLSRGAPATASGHLAAALELYDPQAHDRLAHSHGQDPLAAALVWAGAAAWLTGRPRESRRFTDRALSRARELDHPFTLTYSLHRVAVVHHLSGDDAAMARLVDELVGSDALTRFPYFASLICIHEALLLSRRGDHEAACRIGRNALEQFEQGPARFVEPYVFTTFAEIGLAAEDPSIVLPALDRAEAAIAATGERWNLAEVQRLRARAQMDLAGDRRGASTSLARALETARAHGAIALEVRALLDQAHRAENDHDRAAAVDALRAIAPRLPSEPEDRDQERLRLLLTGNGLLRH